MEYLWCIYFVIIFFKDMVFVGDQVLEYVLVFWMLEYYVWVFFLKMEQIYFVVKFVVIVFFSFFQYVKVVFQFFFIGLCCFIDLGQYWFGGIVMLIGFGYFYQFECIVDLFC